MRGQSRGAAPALTADRPVQDAPAGARDRPDSTLELLLDCVTARRLAESRSRLHRRLAEPIDWGATLDAARRHGVAPLVYQELRAAPDGLVPPAALAPLQQFNLENTRRCLLLTGWLRRVVDGLERAGVQAIPYKGPVLAALAYGAMGARQAGDLDLLIDPGNLETAKEALRADGFRPQVPLQDWQERQLVRSAHPYGLVRDAEHIVLELHWSVSPRSLSSGLGSALPSTPGYVGIYQFAAVSALTPFGFSRADAIAYVLVAQVPSALTNPAGRALTPEIVPTELLPGAIALRSVANQLDRLRTEMVTRAAQEIRQRSEQFTEA
jgi:hypothetical protein